MKLKGVAKPSVYPARRKRVQHSEYLGQNFMYHHTKFRRYMSKRSWYMAISFFQNGGHPPSWICYTHVWTIHERYLLTYVNVQNLAGFGAVVSTICKFSIVRVKFERRIHAPKSFFGISPQYWEQYQRDPEIALHCAETRQMTYTSLKSVHRCGLYANSDSHVFQWGGSCHV